MYNYYNNTLYCGYRGLTELPILLNDLKELGCCNNNLTELPQLPHNLRKLNCSNNNLTELPQLPHNLRTLNCNNNNLTELPQLPLNLRTLNCNNNNLTELPQLPLNLIHFKCYDNIKKLPQQTIIHFTNNLTLQNIIINFIIKNPFKINNTSISPDLTNIILNSKLFRCDICLYNLPECTKYKKEYYIDIRLNVCCYKLSCINCNFLFLICKKIV